MFYFLLGLGVSLFVLGILIAKHFNTAEPLASFWFCALILFFLSWVFNDSSKKEQYQKTCHESNYLVSPTVVHLSDNSGKLLKFISGNSEKTIAINNTEGNFFVPESLLFVDTCNNELKIKK